MKILKSEWVIKLHSSGGRIEKPKVMISDFWLNIIGALAITLMTAPFWL